VKWNDAEIKEAPLKSRDTKRAARKAEKSGVLCRRYAIKSLRLKADVNP
jgi:hypothetical protein